jgi:hypothetical protein
MSAPVISPLLIRSARAADAPALERLAALDSRPLPAGELLVAEAGDGALVAALSLVTGEHVADPFRRSADAVALLHARASQTAPRGRLRRGLLRLATA